MTLAVDRARARPRVEASGELAYRFSLTCPRCGRPCRHQSDGRTNGFEAAVIAACTGCRDRWIIRVTAMSCRASLQGENELAGRPRNCGTPTGFSDHLRAGEDPCDDCRDAQARERRIVADGLSRGVA